MTKSKRPGTPRPGNGGARPGTGPTSGNFTLSASARQELRTITAARGTRPTNEACTAMIENLIHAAWLEYDAGIQDNAEDMIA